MKQLLCILLSLLSTSLAFAQTVVRGVVRESEGPRAGQPLSGAVVSYPKGSQAATTDSAGRFELRPGRPVPFITINHLGY